jgi:hypothetical protein
MGKSESEINRKERKVRKKETGFFPAKALRRKGFKK